MVRVKHRYLLASFVWDDGQVDLSLSAEEFREAIMAQVVNLFGHSGRAKVSETRGAKKPKRET